MELGKAQPQREGMVTVTGENFNITGALFVKGPRMPNGQQMPQITNQAEGKVG